MASFDSTQSIDVFKRLPDNLNGYLLTYFKNSEYINIYDNTQGRFTSRFSPSLSRSNLFLSQNCQFAVKSMNLKCISDHIIELSFNLIEDCNWKLIAEIFPQFHQLEKFTYSSASTPIITQAIGKLGKQLISLSINLNHFDNAMDILPDMEKLMNLKYLTLIQIHSTLCSS